MHLVNSFLGGKQKRSRPGYFHRDGVRIEQLFVFQNGPKAGQAKGLKVNRGWKRKFYIDILTGDL